MIEKLATSLGVANDTPNIELAETLAKTRDKSGVADLVQGLNHPDKAIAGDCIKVLYEIGYRQPELIEKYAINFIDQLLSKNNRMIWGCMIALGTIAHLRPEEIFDNWMTVRVAFETGSVITRDHAITVFAKVYNAGARYQKTVFPLLQQHFSTCRAKEIPQHGERVADAIPSFDNPADAQVLLEILHKRLPELNASAARRVDKVIRRIEAAQRSA